MRAGYVLAGGSSSRMGRDKGLLPFRGNTLVESVAREVEEAAGSVALVGNPAAYGHLGIPFIPDTYPGEGPLGGILTALQVTPADWNLVVACDMPGITAAFLRKLLEAAGNLGVDAVFPAGPAKLPEPLCAVYHRRSRQALYQAFAGGVRKVTAACEGLHTAIFPVPDLAPLQNVNTPEDWAGYASD